METGAVRTVVIRSFMAGLLALTGWSVYSAHAATEAAKAAQAIHAELAQVIIEVDSLQKELGASVEERNALMQFVGALSDARAQLSSIQDEIKALEFSREQ